MLFKLAPATPTLAEVGAVPPLVTQACIKYLEVAEPVVIPPALEVACIKTFPPSLETSGVPNTPYELHNPTVLAQVVLSLGQRLRPPAVLPSV